MPFTGHYLYRGPGGLGTINFDIPLAAIPAGQSEVVLQGAGHIPGARYTYALRPVVNDVVAPDVSCVTAFATDASGQWSGAPPAAPTRVSLSLRPTGTVRVQWRYDTPPGAAAPADFALRIARSLPVDTTAATTTTAAYTRDGTYLQDVPTGAGTFYIALEARSAAGAHSLPAIAGPIVVPLPPTAPPAVRFDAA